MTMNFSCGMNHNCNHESELSTLKSELAQAKERCEWHEKDRQDDAKRIEILESELAAYLEF